MTKQAFTGNERATERYSDEKIAWVRYHDTRVVLYDKLMEVVTLDTGGYPTASTKRRMNQAFAWLELPLYVYQSRYTWYVSDTERSKVFRYTEQRFVYDLIRREAVNSAHV